MTAGAIRAAVVAASALHTAVLALLFRARDERSGRQSIANSALPRHRSCTIRLRVKRYRIGVTLWAELTTPWQAALEQAWKAYRAGSLPMGAVVADRNGRIVGSGRNRIFETTVELPGPSVSLVTGWPMPRSTR